MANKTTISRKTRVKVADSVPAPATKPQWDKLRALLKPDKLPLGLTAVLQHVLKQLHEAAPQMAAGIFLLDEEKRSIQAQVSELFQRGIQEGRGALPEVLRTSAPVTILELPAVEGESVAMQSQIMVSLQASPRVRGALILRSPGKNAFTAADGEALSRIAQKIQTAIENAMIHEEMLQEAGGEAERDLVMAQEIMARLVPRKAPEITGVQVANINVPAKIVGGDFLDYINLRDNHYGFLVADAAGNGIPSALLMTGFRALFRGLIQNEFNIRSVFRRVNEQLVESTASHQFVSAFYAALDVTTRRLIYVNGGHVPPLLYRPDQPPRALEVGGPVLGILPGTSYHEDSVVVKPNDILVLYSDGLSEAESPDGLIFDSHHILRVVENHEKKSAEEICQALLEEVQKFSGAQHADDLTICVLKFL